MIESNLPIYNKDQQIVKFYSNDWYKDIDPLGNFFSIFFTRGALVFKGSIDIHRFINAMDKSFIKFNFILSTLYKNNDNTVFACHPPIDSQDYYSEQLEIEVNNNNSINDIVLDDILPSKTISKEQRSGFVQHFNGLKIKMGVFKLTIFGDGFSIGYNFHHTLFDHSSIVYYLKYLSHLYTFGYQNIKLKEPVVSDAISSIKLVNPFKNIDQVREYSSKVLKYTYKPTKVYRNVNENNTTNKILLQIKLNIEEIDKLKSTVNGLSKNDIISALLIKIYNLNEEDDGNVNDDQYFTYGYTVNIRKLLSLDTESTIGNLIHQRRNPIKIKEIKEKSLIEIAFINRDHVSKISIEDFMKFLGMCEIIQKEKENIVDYYNEPTNNITRTTNWSSFDYDSIVFDKSSPLSLKHHHLASVNVNIISFDTDILTGKKYLTTQISVPSNSINRIKEYADISKLYSIDKFLN